MSGFDLDLRTVEEHIASDDGEEEVSGPHVVLGILDGSTPPEEWIDHVENGDVLVLDINGDLNQLAAGFARQIKEDDGELIRFRGFLIVTPEGIEIDTDRLDA